MDKFEVHKGLAAPLDLANADTDQIIPKQFLKRVERKGYGDFLFFHHRFLENNQPNPDFTLNQKRYLGASILLGRENFGGGSSREHAAWALLDYGFKVIIAPSFADIFRNNSFNNGMLLVEQSTADMDQWFERCLDREGYEITVDLPNQTLTGSDGFSTGFEITEARKERLLKGLDNIGLTLARQAAIEEYEKGHDTPWQAGVARADA